MSNDAAITVNGSFFFLQTINWSNIVKCNTHKKSFVVLLSWTAELSPFQILFLHLFKGKERYLLESRALKFAPPT